MKKLTITLDDATYAWIKKQLPGYSRRVLENDRLENATSKELEQTYDR